MIHRTRIFSWFLSLLLVLPVAAAAQEGYRIAPGDVLSIEVLEDEALNRSVLVDPGGRISFPLAGTILAQGKTVAAVQGLLVAKLAPNFAAPPSVFVALQQVAPPSAPVESKSATIDVYFVGEVNNSGLVEIKPGTTLLQAVAISGGVTRFAAIKRIQLRRTGADGVQRVTILNYKALANGAVTNDIVLRDGDVILVPERRLFE
ncbi:MAG: polysaccharide biosynthesis/export family protein [Tateyamaria sp.]|uniref:polysaccharide biosynthesis/export family protein n=1 Tax=Rhodobacterales TaxID=204455 RepID=UPI0032956461